MAKAEKVKDEKKEQASAGEIKAENQAGHESVETPETETGPEQNVGTEKSEKCTGNPEAEMPDAGTETNGNKIRLKIRNKTGRPTYYRAGLCFAQAEAEYEVSQDVAEVLKADGWLIVEEVK